MDKHKMLEPPMMGAIIGVLLAILALTFGFWKLLLIIILAAIGWFIGFLVQALGLTGSKLKRLFSK